MVDCGGQGVILQYVGNDPRQHQEAVKISPLYYEGMVAQAHKEMTIGSLRSDLLVAPSRTAVSCDPRLVCLFGGQAGDAVLVQNMEFISGGTLDAALPNVSKRYVAAMCTSKACSRLCMQAHRNPCSALVFASDLLLHAVLTIAFLLAPLQILVGYRERAVLCIADKLLQALCKLHGAPCGGFAHHDLKLQNIMLREGQLDPHTILSGDFELCLVDFGLANYLDTENMNIGGSLATMSPEVMDGLSMSTAAIDV